MPTITQLPWSSTGAGTYTFGGNLSISNGDTALNVQHNNVIIDFSTFTMSWDGQGKWLDVNGHSSVTVKNGTVTQGSANPDGGSLTNAEVNGTTVLLMDLTLNLKATSKLSARRNFFTGDASGTCVVQDCIINISGSGGWSLFLQMDDWIITGCVITISNWSHSNPDYYARMVDNCDGIEIHHNDITAQASTAGGTDDVNFFFGWNDQNYHIHHNRITRNLTNGRLMVMDHNCSGWIVEDNEIIIANPVSADAIYVFRPRVTGTSDSHNHTFRRNRVITTNSTGEVNVISIGDGGAKSRDITVDRNIFIGRGSLYQHYNESNAQNVKVTCNDLTEWTSTPLDTGQPSQGNWTFINNSNQTQTSNPGDPPVNCWQGAGPIGTIGAGSGARTRNIGQDFVIDAGVVGGVGTKMIEQGFKIGPSKTATLVQSFVIQPPIVPRLAIQQNFLIQSIVTKTVKQGFKIGMALVEFDPPLKPSYGSSIELNSTPDRIRFHKGYDQVSPKLLRAVKPAELRWDAVDDAEKDYIESFMDQFAGSLGPFTWQPFDNVPSPTGIKPMLSEVDGGGLSQRIYYVGFTWYDSAYGQTKISKLTQLTVSANKLVKVDFPPVPNFVEGARIYIDVTVSTNPELQATVIGARTWTEPATGVISGVSSPSTNTLNPLIKFMFGGTLNKTRIGPNTWRLSIRILEQIV